MELGAAEHAELVTSELAPGQVDEALSAATVDEWACESPRPDGDLKLENGLLRVTGNEIDHLAPALHTDMNVSIAVGSLW